MNKFDLEQEDVKDNKVESFSSREVETMDGLENLADHLQEDILSDAERDKSSLKDMLDQVDASPEGGNELIIEENEALNIKADKIQEEALVRLKAVLMAAKESPVELNAMEKKNLNTTYTEIPSEEASLRLKRIPSEMQHALNTFGQVFKDSEYPWTTIGSNSLVLEAETEKKVDDIDLVFAIQDLPSVYQKIESLEAAGEISDFNITEMEDLSGKPDNCFRLSGKVKSGDELIDFEAFAINNDSSKKANSFINIGFEQHNVNVYQIPDADGNMSSVNMIDRDGVEELYRKNLLNEFTLFELEGWQNRGFLNNKAIQRLANLQNLGRTPDQIIDSLSNEKTKTAKAEEVKGIISNLLSRFKQKDYKGPGLTKSLGEKLNIPDNHYRHEKIADFITKETNKQMQTIGEVMDLMVVREKEIISGDEKSLFEYSKFIEDKISQVASIHNQYNEYLELSNSEDASQDFALYASLIRLKDYFSQPVLTKLSLKKIEVEDKLLNLKK